MKGKKKLALCTVLVPLIAAGGILAAVYISGNEESCRQQEHVNHEEEGTTETQTTETQKNIKPGEKHWRVYQFRELGNLYYLTEDEEDFREKISAFIVSENLNASTVTALSKFKDTKEDLSGKACFYLQIDDEERTVIEAEYDKKTAEYSFRIFEEEIPNIEDYGGEKRGLPEEETCAFADPEYVNEWEEEVDLGNPAVEDPEKKLAEVEKQEEQFYQKLLEFLKQEKEDRRNLTVIKAVRTEKGYEAELSFEHARVDEKNIKVMYNRDENQYTFILSLNVGERRGKNDG